MNPHIDKRASRHDDFHQAFARRHNGECPVLSESPFVFETCGLTKAWSLSILLMEVSVSDFIALAAGRSAAGPLSFCAERHELLPLHVAKQTSRKLTVDGCIRPAV